MELIIFNIFFWIFAILLFVGGATIVVSEFIRKRNHVQTGCNFFLLIVMVYLLFSLKNMIHIDISSEKYRIEIESVTYIQPYTNSDENFTLGTDKFLSRINIHYKTEDENDGVKIHQVSKNGVKIFYSDTARIETVVYRPIHKLGKWIKMKELRLYIPRNTEYVPS